MKKTIVSILIIAIIWVAACNKKQGVYDNECSDYNPMTVSVSLCTSDTCTTYFAIWKELFMQKNNMSESDFDDLVAVYNTQVLNIPSGTLFDVKAKFKSGWTDAFYQDQFFIKITGEANNYTGTVPKNKLLTKAEIVQYLFDTNDSFNFVKINKGNLFYTNPDVVLKLLAKKANVNRFCNYSINVSKSTGNLVLSVFTNVIDNGTSVCIDAEADLNMGDLTSSESRGCVID